jgi:hypothetical protein
MSANAEDMAIAQAIGEVKGTLEVLLKLTQQNNDQLNRRMDDLTHAVNQRIDDHSKSNDQRFSLIEQRINTHDSQIEEQKYSARKAMSSGGIAGVIVTSGVEICKRVLGG